jgi:hypothetical protein
VSNETLFDWAWRGQYPESPGFKEHTTSREAARAVVCDSGVIRERAYQVIVDAGERGATPDEVADALGLSVLSVRPRVSELGKLERIERTPVRRRNISGLNATVWRAKACAD